MFELDDMYQSLVNTYFQEKASEVRKRFFGYRQKKSGLGIYRQNRGVFSKQCYIEDPSREAKRQHWLAPAIDRLGGLYPRYSIKAF
jgi:hypothetical protein